MIRKRYIMKFIKKQAVITLCILSILITSVLNAQTADSDTTKEKEKTPSKSSKAIEKKNIKKGKKAFSDLPISKKKVLLGIGKFCVYKMGDGDTHEGEEAFSINPEILLSVSYFFIDGFALGIVGSFEYNKTKSKFGLDFLPINIELISKMMYGNVGLHAAYFFKVTDKFFPYIGLIITYGMGKTENGLPIFSKTKYSSWEFEALVGVTFAITKNLGIYLDIAHMRDILNNGSKESYGHITSINLGLKVFI